MIRTVKIPVLLLWLSTMMLSAGEVFAQLTEIPSLELQTLDGKTVNLQDYCRNGKITVLNFWATWCAPCKTELNNIAKTAPHWESDYGAEFIAINLDEAKNLGKVKKWSSEWPFTVLFDHQALVLKTFNIEMPPYTILIDQKGQIITGYSGYRDGDEFILEEKIKGLL